MEIIIGLIVIAAVAGFVIYRKNSKTGTTGSSTKPTGPVRPK